MKFFLDTFALVEIAEESPSYGKYLDSDAITLKENLVELYYIILRKYGQGEADRALVSFSGIAMDLPLSIIAKAMLFRSSYKQRHFSYIDCLSYFYALENKRIFLTGDRAFQGLESVEIVR